MLTPFQTPRNASRTKLFRRANDDFKKQKSKKSVPPPLIQKKRLEERFLRAPRAIRVDAGALALAGVNDTLALCDDFGAALLAGFGVGGLFLLALGWGLVAEGWEVLDQAVGEEGGRHCLCLEFGFVETWVDEDLLVEDLNWVDLD
jgi:hypothetical protein